MLTSLNTFSNSESASPESMFAERALIDAASHPNAHEHRGASAREATTAAPPTKRADESRRAPSDLEVVKLLVYAFGIVILAAGCRHVATMQLGGHTLETSDTREAMGKIASRASFELDCPRDQLEMVPLSTSAFEDGSWGRLTQVGVTGCTRKAVYVRHSPYGYPYPGDEWMVNTEGGKVK